MPVAIPLSWLQLKQDKLRLAIALLGVGFAVVLIFMQLGFQEALFQSSVRLHHNFNYDIAIISPRTDFIGQPRTFSRRRVYQAVADPDVASSSSVYLGTGLFQNPIQSEQGRPIYIVGFDPSLDLLNIPAVRENRDRLKVPNQVIFDRASRPEYGPIEALFNGGAASAGLFTEINNRRIEIAGLYELGTSFGIDGSIVTSDLNFLRIFPDQQPGLVHLGLVELRPGANAQDVRDRLDARLPGDIEVLTRDGFIQREVDYWSKGTPIGYVFSFGVIVGLLVGSIIVYQILFADVSDHLQEYATLKAMGYSNRYLFGLVFQEAVMMAFLGFLPGMALTLFLYQTAGSATQLPLEMTWARAIVVLSLTVAMCTVSGVIAARKVRTLDPADIF